MFERFTDRARKAMALANQEARRFNHEYIGPEHILLGLIREASGVGANVLKNLDVDLRKVRLEVEKLIMIGPDMVTMGNLPQTPRAKKVIEYAIEEARNLNHNYVGTEHLLLGLLKAEQGNTAYSVLSKLEVNIDRVRNGVLTLLGQGQMEGRDLEQPFLSTTESWSATIPVETPADISISKPGDLAQYFTPRSQRIITLAHQSAIDFKHSHLGTEHMLVGMISEGYGVAAAVLRNNGVYLQKVKDQIAILVPPSDNPLNKDLPWTPSMDRMIALSSRASQELGHNYIGTEHLLIGLLRDGEDIGCHIVARLGLNPADLIEEVLILIRPARTASTARTASADEQGQYLDKLRQIQEIVNRPDEAIIQMIREIVKDI